MILQANAESIPLLDNSVHLIVTSPPYNLGKDYGAKRDDATYNDFMAWLSFVLDDMYRVLVEGGRLCLNIPLDINLQFTPDGKKKSQKKSFYSDVMELPAVKKFIYNTCIIWNEGNTSHFTGWGSWMSPGDPWVNTAVEMIVVLSKGTRKRKLPYTYEHDIYQREFLEWVKGVWTFPGESAKRIGHPAPFPVQLPYRCIRLFSLIGDTVLDPFSGSGTTGVAAQQIDRKYVGLDMNFDYCKLAIDRIGIDNLTQQV